MWRAWHSKLLLQWTGRCCASSELLCSGATANAPHPPPLRRYTAHAILTILPLVHTMQGIESAEKTGSAARKAADRDTADMESFLQVRLPCCYRAVT
jgi:hypothetical protein